MLAYFAHVPLYFLPVHIFWISLPLFSGHNTSLLTPPLRGLAFLSWLLWSPLGEKPAPRNWKGHNLFLNSASFSSTPVYPGWAGPQHIYLWVRISFILLFNAKRVPTGIDFLPQSLIIARGGCPVAVFHLPRESYFEMGNVAYGDKNRFYYCLCRLKLSYKKKTEWEQKKKQKCS